ncbi:hypothetical protein BT93_C1519 [Corymbia citriodora subsp. variegata]|nr:hypothetical protein BT93_C1519 [Corymbia citriodora subsp. variegata]
MRLLKSKLRRSRWKIASPKAIEVRAYRVKSGPHIVSIAASARGSRSQEGVPMVKGRSCFSLRLETELPLPARRRAARTPVSHRSPVSSSNRPLLASAFFSSSSVCCRRSRPPSVQPPSPLRPLVAARPFVPALAAAWTEAAARPPSSGSGLARATTVARRPATAEPPCHRSALPRRRRTAPQPPEPAVLLSFQPATCPSRFCFHVAGVPCRSPELLDADQASPRSRPQPAPSCWPPPSSPVPSLAARIAVLRLRSGRRVVRPNTLEVPVRPPRHPRCNCAFAAYCLRIELVNGYTLHSQIPGKFPTVFQCLELEAMYK